MKKARLNRTPMQLVKSKYPNATVWWPQKAYILSSRGNGIVDFIGKGNTPKAAWNDALNMTVRADSKPEEGVRPPRRKEK